MAVVMVYAGWGCKRKEEGMKMPARPPAMVTVAPATTADVPVYLDQIGKTVSVQLVSVVSQVAGKIVEAPVKDGALLQKGDLLFQLDPRPFQAALDAAVAALAENKADWEYAQLEYSRVQKLNESGAISQVDIDQKKNALDIAQTKIDAAKANIETARLNLEYTTIRSPFDGRAGVLLIDAGNVIKDNGLPMLVIQQLDPILAEFTITENDLGMVRKYMAQRGMPWGAQLPRGIKVWVSIPAQDSGKTIGVATTKATTQPHDDLSAPREGELVFIDNTVQAGGTIKLRAQLANSDYHFWPGQFVNVRLVLATLEKAVLIPTQAQQIGQQGSYIYVVTPDNKAEIRPIVPGQRQGEMLVVEKGLEPGERVVITGQLAVVPGGEVRIMENNHASPPEKSTTGAVH